MLHELLKLQVEGDAVVGEQSAVKTWLKLAKNASRSLAEGTDAAAVLLELIEDAQGVLKRLLGETPLNVKMKAEHAAVLKVVEQMRALLLANGFELDAGGKFTSPIDGHTPVAVLYALMVWGISHGVYKLKLLLADCACVPRRPHTHHRTASHPVTPTLLWCAHVVSRTVCAYRARSYGLMRLATYGTGDLNRMSKEMRAAGQLRGELTLQESREHATVAYQIGELLRAAPQTAIRVELWVLLDLIGRKEPLRRIITITGPECSSSAAFAAGELKGFFFDLWHITNQGVGRTAAEVLNDKVRAPRAPLPPPSPCAVHRHV